MIQRTIFIFTLLALVVTPIFTMEEDPREGVKIILSNDDSDDDIIIYLCDLTEAGHLSDIPLESSTVPLMPMDQEETMNQEEGHDPRCPQKKRKDNTSLWSMQFKKFKKK